MESDAESILQKGHTSALKRMKEANEYAKRLLAQHPDAVDAYIAPASPITLLDRRALVPASHCGLVEFTGQETRMEQLAKTAENGLYLKPFAKIVLALAARREKQDPSRKSCCAG